MKKFFYNSIDQFIMKIILFALVLNLLFLFSAVLLAKEHNLKMVISQGRAVIQSNDLQLAKKRALDEALYLASLQGGAKIDGYSSIDEKTSLKENLLVRPSSQIVDFKVLDELNNSLALNELSMGMSSDYKEAIGFNATFVRLGSSIFGSRS